MANLDIQSLCAVSIEIVGYELPVNLVNRENYFHINIIFYLDSSKLGKQYINFPQAVRDKNEDLFLFCLRTDRY